MDKEDIPASIDPERLAQLEAALRALPKLNREIFLAARLDDMSYEEIARITGLSVKGVQRAMVDALIDIGRHVRGAPLLTPLEKLRRRFRR